MNDSLCQDMFEFYSPVALGEVYNLLINTSILCAIIERNGRVNIASNNIEVCVGRCVNLHLTE